MRSVHTSSPNDGSLNASRRRCELDWLAEGHRVDVLVIGGGITGVGAALDAAARGLSVALIERGDLAGGTSGKSSRLVHGGIRYLAGGEVSIAWESARERHLLMTKIAPHLTQPLPFVWPLNRELGPAMGATVEVVLRVADVLRRRTGTPARLLPRARRIDPALTRTLLPALKSDGLRGGLLYWDGQLSDDARLVVTIARTAAALGARIVTRCEAESCDEDVVRVRDVLGGDAFDLRARVVINATGVWASRLTAAVKIKPSRGSHLLVPAPALGEPRAALQIPVVGEGRRALLAMPTSLGSVLVGPTDVPATSDDPPEPSEEEIDHLLGGLNRALAVPLRRADVIGSYAGLRPLVDRGEGATADLSRRHAIIEELDRRLVTVTGGKLTTYRAMAEQAVEAALRVASVQGPPSPTARLPLVGAAPREQLRLVAAPTRLVARYGSEAPRLMTEAGRRAAPEALVEGLPYLWAEARFALAHEGALTAEDVVERRLGLRDGSDARAALLRAIEDKRNEEILA